MKSNISDKAKGTVQKGKDKYDEIAVEQIDKSKLEGEGACETIVGKDEKEVCEVRT
jgi:hypothetical protein